jgi:hypothetical protein
MNAWCNCFAIHAQIAFANLCFAHARRSYEFRYRDRNFVLFYRWIQFDASPANWRYQVDVFAATRTRDFDQDATIPRQ